MRVIVTRPITSAHRTAERLAALGHEPVLLPLTNAHRFPEVAREALRHPHSVIAITSAEAIRTLEELQAGEPGILEPVLSRPLHTVGAASAAAAQRLGFSQVRSAGGTGEDLARQLDDAGETQVLYLAGSPRSPGFEQGLAKAGIAVTTVEVYAMRQTDLSDDTLAALARQPDAVLFYSSESVRIFLQNMPLFARFFDPSFVRALCLSRNIAEALPNDTFSAVDVAPRPTEDDLLLLL